MEVLIWDQYRLGLQGNISIAHLKLQEPPREVALGLQVFNDLQPRTSDLEACWRASATSFRNTSDGQATCASTAWPLWSMLS